MLDGRRTGVFQGLLALPLVAAPAAQDAAEFEKGRTYVQRLMESGRWAKARAELLELVDEHEGEPYVLFQRASIVDDVKRCTFYETYEEPDPKELISGELLSYRPSSGRVKIRYGRDQLDDFSTGGNPLSEVLLHPLTFDGAYSVSIDYESYPKSESPQVIVGYDTEAPVYAVFGRKKEGAGMVLSWIPGRILMRDEPGGELEVVAEESSPPIRSGEKVTVKVGVKSGTVALYANGRKYLTAKRKQGIYGQVALIGTERATGFEIQGETQPSWFQGLLDQALQEKWGPFEEAFRPAEHLPGWLAEAGEATASAGSTEHAYPGERLPGQDALMAKIMEVLERDANRALELATSADPSTTTETFRCFVEGLALAAAGEHEKALEPALRAHELDQGHRGASLLAARLLIATGRRREAVGTLEELQLRSPDDVEVVRELARALLSLGEMDRAKEAVEFAIVSGVHPTRLEEVQAYMNKALRGPDWGERYDYRSRNYHVVSDIDDKTCFEAASHLEKSLQRFQRDLRRTSEGGDRRYVVYLFSGSEGYQAYVEDIIGVRRENTNGLYSSLLKQLLIWNLPDRERMFETVRHEGFHQYFDRLVEHAPRWLNEGLAEYYEIIELVDGAWQQGRANVDHLRILRGKEPLPLEEFVRISDRRFFADVGLAYAQSWAFVHFLRHGGPDEEALFDRLIDALVDGAPAQKAVDAAFAGVSLSALDRAFREHVASL